MVEMTRPKFPYPVVQQDQVAKNAIEKLSGETAIGAAQGGLSQTVVQNRVREFSSIAPLA
jgi:hypothetical protein